MTNKKFLHDFESYRDEKKSSTLKEGMSIYEFEDETQNDTEISEEPIADLDSETPSDMDAVEETPAPEEAPIEEAPIEEAPVAEEPVDFGDGGVISQETAKSELDFILGVMTQYNKLAKAEIKLDDSIKAKIRKAFDILK